MTSRSDPVPWRRQMRNIACYLETMSERTKDVIQRISRVFLNGSVTWKLYIEFTVIVSVRGPCY